MKKVGKLDALCISYVQSSPLCNNFAKNGYAMITLES
jgi:hypothetical protein